MKLHANRNMHDTINNLIETVSKYVEHKQQSNSAEMEGEIKNICERLGEMKDRGLRTITQIDNVLVHVDIRLQYATR